MKKQNNIIVTFALILAAIFFITFAFYMANAFGNGTLNFNEFKDTGREFSGALLVLFYIFIPVGLVVHRHMD